MMIVHTLMTAYLGREGGTVFTAAVMDARWIDQATGRWEARHIRDTAHSFRVMDGERLTLEAEHARRDQFAREVAALIGLPAGPDHFPFSTSPEALRPVGGGR